MKRVVLVLALPLLTLVVLSGGERLAAGDVIPGRYIVVLQPGVSPQDVAAAHGVRPDVVYMKALQGFAGPASAAQARRLAGDPRVRSVEPDRIVSLAPPQGQGRGSNSATQPLQSLPTGVNRIDGDLSPTAKIDGSDERVNVDIAIIDTGIDLKHPDLSVFRNVTFVTGTKSGNDDNGHGTHVAGTAAALDNGIGVVGVAPGARLWAVKVLNKQGSGFLSWIVAGIDYVTRNAASIDAANMSLGCQCFSPAMDTAIAGSVAAGVTYVVAAGNSASDAATFSPANHPDVITVSAMADFNGVGGGGAAPTCRADVDDTFADFSNFGASVEIAAPGVCILSTWKGGGYNTISGTSMASPHGAGAAALVVATRGRDVNGDGLVNGADAAAVRSTLIAAGKAQSDPVYGFSGDPDAFAEPLLFVAGF